MTLYLLGHPFNKPLHFCFLSGSRCYWCIEKFGKMETFLHLSSESQSHFCRQSKNKQPHNTLNYQSRWGKTRVVMATHSIDLGTFWGPYPELQSTECHTLQATQVLIYKTCFYTKGQSSSVHNGHNRTSAADRTDFPSCWTMYRYKTPSDVTFWVYYQTFEQ